MEIGKILSRIIKVLPVNEPRIGFHFLGDAYRIFLPRLIIARRPFQLNIYARYVT